ncbi:TonB-dependent receptor family protein [Mucilaginibacter sp. UR6-1]|uniref:outer membrane beta-barrel family protein n=1 Tax=Mucilaginibacter sp. UR6-1 TaxID=1435643 RepID=UPI001E3D9ACC|nr:outer membrane beta-barrel family protein [Mucilaginibacter sp. UR6-1]MCC8410899.1 TonB-dependent receptor family protein [Mucilaginibacter sp. UR6-1]
MKMLLQDKYCPNFYTLYIYICAFIFRIAATMALFIAAFNVTNAQTSSKISGSILNEAGKPMEFATLSLLRAKDSSIVKGTMADANGKYAFEKITAGDYIVAATTMGYQKSHSAKFTLGSQAVNLPALSMQPASQSLKTVNITAAKPLVERKADRLVMNVENSIVATGNSALEVLERAPGVTVDKDDNISLQGKAGVTVMINDKLTYLSSTQLANLLRSTDGSTIQSIELITNPSSKYDAAGNSGIINIKLKKNKQSGFNGSLTAGAGYGLNFRDNTSLNLNIKEGDWNFFGSFSRGDIKRENTMNLLRTVTNSTGTTFFNQRTDFVNQVHFNNYRFGADYNTSKRNVIGFIVSGDHSNGFDDNGNVTNIGPSFNQVDSVQNTPSTIDQSFRNIALNLNDKFDIDTLGQSISVDVDYSKFRNNSNALYTTNFFLGDGTQYKDPLMIANITPSKITINTQKVDYVKPLNKTLKLELGAKFSFVKTDNDLQAKIDSTGNGLVDDAGRTNHFIYDEKIKAGYFNLSKEFKTTSVQLGLRAEHTKSKGDLVTTNNVVERSYLNFFPTLFVNQKLGKKHELGFNYSRRIDRPSYEDLNPFVYYLDQFTYSQGNPFLKPQYTNSFELNYTYNKTINLSFNYSHTSDVFTEVILTDTVRKATYQTNLNFNSQDSYSLNLNTPYTLFKWWTGNLTFTGFYNNFKANDLLGGNLNKGRASFFVKTTNTFLLPKEIKAEIMTFYQSSVAYGIYNIKPQYYIDMGLSRSFLNKKLNVKFAVSDVFWMRRNNITANYQTVDLDIRQKRETRIARINLTYNFGNTKIKARNRQTGADDESNRVKSRN